jgi:hypothetical protein
MFNKIQFFAMEVFDFFFERFSVVLMGLCWEKGAG